MTDYYIIATLIYLFCMGMVYLIWKCQDLNRREYALLFFVGLVMVWLSPALLERLGPTTLFMVYTLVPLAAAIVSTKMGKQKQVVSEVRAVIDQAETQMNTAEVQHVSTLSSEDLPPDTELKSDWTLRRWYLKNNGQLRYNRDLLLPVLTADELCSVQDPLVTEPLINHQEDDQLSVINPNGMDAAEIVDILSDMVPAEQPAESSAMLVEATSIGEAETGDKAEGEPITSETIEPVEDTAAVSFSIDEGTAKVEEPVQEVVTVIVDETAQDEETTELMAALISDQTDEPVGDCDNEITVDTVDTVDAEEITGDNDIDDIDDGEEEPLGPDYISAGKIIIEEDTPSREFTDQLELTPVIAQNELILDAPTPEIIQEMTVDSLDPADLENIGPGEGADSETDISADIANEELAPAEKIDDREEKPDEPEETAIFTNSEAEAAQPQTGKAADIEEEEVTDIPEAIVVDDETDAVPELIAEEVDSGIPAEPPVVNIPAAIVIEQMGDSEGEIRHNIAEGILSPAEGGEFLPETEAGIEKVLSEQKLVKSARERMMEEKVDRLLDAGFNAKFATNWPEAIKCFAEALKIAQDTELRGMLVRDIAGMYLEIADYQRAQQTYQDYINNDLPLEERKDLTRGMLKARYMEQELTNREMPLMPYRKVPRLLQIKVEEMLNRVDISKQVEGSKKRK